MKKAFTKKLLLEENKIDEKADLRTVVFRSYLKEDYVEKSLKLTIDGEILKYAYFSSNDYGTSYWTNGRGIHDSHRWENDDDLHELPALSRHYPTLLQDGEVTVDTALGKIIPDVLESLLDEQFKEILYDIITNKTFDEPIDFDGFIKKYSTLSEKYLKELNT